MDVSSKQAELDSVTWYHEFEFGHGLRTRTHCPHIDDHRRIWRFVESHLAAVDFRDKSVLDIGAWDGYWSFYAEKRGARSVLASDDLGQNWSAGRGIHLARELLGSSVEIDQDRSVYDLASLNQKFDVVLFLGVYYHLHDPFHALAQIRHCCHPNTVVVIDGPVTTGLRWPGALYDYRNHAHEWLPSLEALQQVLEATYFTSTVGGYFDPRSAAQLGWRGRVKRGLKALGSALPARLRRLLPERQPQFIPWRRVFLTCAPFEGVVAAHHYKPPFNLHKYDPRFRDAPPRTVSGTCPPARTMHTVG